MSWRLNHKETLVSRWPLQGKANDVMGRWPGTPANMTGWPPSGPHNGLSCAELNGNNSNISLGDITQLNAVEAFSLCFWMNQDVLDQQDTIFDKISAATSRIAIATWDDGRLYFLVRNGSVADGWFDYSTLVSAGTWCHIACVFDGSGADNASRMQMYVNGAPATLTFTLTIPAISPDLSGQDAMIGLTALAFDGRLQDFRLYNVPLTRDEVNKIIRAPAPSI
jgi:hypothetical protein